MYRLLRTAEAFRADPATRPDVEGLLLSLDAAAEGLPGGEVPVAANNLTRAVLVTGEGGLQGRCGR